MGLVWESQSGSELRLGWECEVGRAAGWGWGAWVEGGGGKGGGARVGWAEEARGRPWWVVRGMQ